NGPVSLPDAVAMLGTAYLGHVIVLWSWALKQPNPDDTQSITVRFRSLDGRDREIAVPHLTFTEPICYFATCTRFCQPGDGRNGDLLSRRREARRTAVSGV